MKRERKKEERGRDRESERDSWREINKQAIATSLFPRGKSLSLPLPPFSLPPFRLDTFWPIRQAKILADCQSVTWKNHSLGTGKEIVSLGGRRISLSLMTVVVGEIPRRFGCRCDVRCDVRCTTRCAALGSTDRLIFNAHDGGTKRGRGGRGLRAMRTKRGAQTGTFFPLGCVAALSRSRTTVSTRCTQGVFYFPWQRLQWRGDWWWTARTRRSVSRTATVNRPSRLSLYS